jgi:hypothetical protein
MMPPGGVGSFLVIVRRRIAFCGHNITGRVILSEIREKVMENPKKLN